MRAGRDSAQYPRGNSKGSGRPQVSLGRAGLLDQRNPAGDRGAAVAYAWAARHCQ